MPAPTTHPGPTLCAPEIASSARRVDVLPALFFLSGSAALIYQVMWQRLLFTLFGVDMESTTIIVSVFMLGLGVGALAGGVAADAFPRRRLLCFVLAELLIGLFGALSPWAIDLLAAALAGSGRVATALASFALFLLPTTLMGGTLPVLVAHVHEREGHVGRSVGQLYFANTLGAAAGAVTAGFILLNVLTDVDGSIHLAAALNVGIAAAGAWNLRAPR